MNPRVSPRAAVAGRDYDASAPAVVDGVAYLTTSESEGYQRIATAVNVSTGEQVWETGAPSGDAAWVDDAAPTVTNDYVFVAAHDLNTHYFYALDRETGNLVWSFSQVGGDFVSAPVVGNGTVYVRTTDAYEQDYVYAFDTATGEQEWAWDLPSDADGNQDSPGALAYDAATDTVYVSASYQLDSAPEDRYAGYVYALNGSAGYRESRDETEGQIEVTPTVADGGVVVGTTNGYVHSTGAGWDQLLRRDSSVPTSAAVDDEQAYIPSTVSGSGSIVHALNRSDGTEAWRTDLPGDTRIFESPVTDGETVYVPAEDSLYLLDAANGSIVDSFSLRSPSTPALYGDRVYVGAAGTDESLYAIAENTPPNASFTVTPVDEDRIEVNGTVRFDASTSSDAVGAIMGYEWDFDSDGTVDATGKIANHTFTSPGERTVTLTVTDDSGATDSHTRTTNVTDRVSPTAAFEITPTEPIANESVYFDAAGSSDPDGSITTYEWDFDSDGTVDATGKIANHTFTGPGERTVALTVTDDSGLADTGRLNVTVNRGPNAPPRPWPTYQGDTGRTGYASDVSASREAPEVALRAPVAGSDYDASAPAVVDGVAYLTTSDTEAWDRIAVAVNVTTGEQLWETGAPVGDPAWVDGAAPTVTDDYVFVAAHDLNTHYFYALDRETGNLVWRFAGDWTEFVSAPVVGNGTVYVRTTEDSYQDHVYAFDTATGEREWTWDVPSDADGNEDSPGALAYDPGTDRVYVSASYRLDSSPDPYSYAGYVYALDGETGTQVSGYETRTEGGIDVTPTVADGGVVVSTANGYVHSTGAGWDQLLRSGSSVPTSAAVDDARAYVPSTVLGSGSMVHALNRSDGTEVWRTDLPGDTRIFESPVTDGETVYVPAASIVYLLDAANGSIIDSISLRSPSTPALYGDRAYIGATPSTAGMDESLYAITENTPPNASFAVTPVGGDRIEVNGTVRFDASASSDAVGSITSYEWDFDSNGTVDATGKIVNHTFTASGEQTATLTVTDDSGATDSHITTVNVTDREPPTAAFEITPTEPIANESVYFDAAESSDPDGAIPSYEWDFDSDGTIEATGESLFYRLAEPGERTVTLTVTDDDGLADTATLNLSVIERPNATFSYSPTVPAVGEWVTFDASRAPDTGGPIDSYDWYLDDACGVDESGQTAGNSFETAGPTDVRLVVSNKGVTDELTRTIQVNGRPVPAFQYTPNPATVGEPTTLDASNSTDDGSIKRYEWDFDLDGTVDATGQRINHTFSGHEIYDYATVTLTVVDNQGAQNSTRRRVSLNEPPTAAFEYGPSSPTAGRPVTFDASDSADPDGPITSYEWDVGGDGTVDATGETANVTFQSRGDQTVALTVTDTDGASTTVRRQVDVRNSPPTLTTPEDTLVTVVGRALSLASNVSDPDGTVTNVTVEESGISQTTGPDTPTVTFGAPTWNSSTDSYRPVVLTVTAMDDTGATTRATASVVVEVPGDATGDGVVDVFDAVAIGQQWGASTVVHKSRLGADRNGDGVVDILDAAMVGQTWGTSANETST